ncbi:NAD(P)-dependent oxidoreductase [Micromonospora vinacea]|uniref:NAD-dependent epimerase/dehydratase family protein n=1 Tax=Micromonospora vinacea TaxID=709878 RepID=UPI0034558464
MTGRALVVGTGLLGRHVRDRLTSAGWDVVVAGRRSDVATRSLTEAIRAARPGVVVNAAGEIWRPEPDRLAAANVELAGLVVRAVAEAGADARLVHLGSSLEYAPQPPPTALTEDSPAAPRSAYGRSKLAGTELVRRLAARHGVEAVVLRLFNVIGAGMSPVSVLGRTVNRLVAADRAGTTAHLELTDLAQYRDYVDARDAADAVLAAGTARQIAPGLFNIGSGVTRTAEELVRALAEVSGVPYRLELRPPATTGARSADGDWQRADSRRAYTVLGWSARRTLPETLLGIWLAARSHPIPGHSAQEASTP